MSKKLTQSQLNKILIKHNFTPCPPAPIYNGIKTHQIDLFGTTYKVMIEPTTRMCKFYTLYGKFDSNYDSISKILEINSWSGKCNRHFYSTDELELFLINLQLLNKTYKEVTPCQNI